ncbi:MAG: hypothetical protein ACLFQL_01700 [Paracoccaceae bacterium]
MALAIFKIVAEHAMTDLVNFESHAPDIPSFCSDTTSPGMTNARPVFHSRPHRADRLVRSIRMTLQTIVKNEEYLETLG